MVARQRVIIVYNPRSSRAGRVQREVVGAWRRRAGILVGKFEVAATDVDDNARRLAKLLADGDVVIAAGGDGTATITVNGAMLSGKAVELTVLPYGNFNDTARTLVRLARRGVRRFYPLEILVDGRHWRYAASYVTVGMLAESTEIFDRKRERRHLQLVEGSFLYSVRRLARWYFQNKEREFLPSFRLNGEEVEAGVSDYLAINGVSAAQVMRGGWWGADSQRFLGAVGRLTSFRRLMGFLLRSAVQRVPGRETTGEALEFFEPATVEVQAEGEYRKLEGVRKIEVRKARGSIGIWA